MALLEAIFVIKNCAARAFDMRVKTLRRTEIFGDARAFDMT
jgi:hypothetical protein